MIGAGVGVMVGVGVNVCVGVGVAVAGLLTNGKNPVFWLAVGVVCAKGLPEPIAGGVLAGVFSRRKYTNPAVTNINSRMTKLAPMRNDLRVNFTDYSQGVMIHPAQSITKVKMLPDC
jgi:hypothetical protein